MTLHPLLVKTKIYQVLLVLSRPFQFVHEYMQYLKWAKVHLDKGLVNDYYNKNAAYKHRFRLHETLIDQLKLREQVLNYFEFGVAKGDMIKYWAAQNQNPSSTFVGFDSFEGLPEGWEGKGKGHFDEKGNMPETSDNRITFIKGWFQETVFQTLPKFQYHNQSVFHLDADLFSSTIFVLFHLHPYLKSGDILIFDEYSSFQHEHKAFELFQQSTGKNWDFKFIGAVNNYRQVAFQIS